MEISTLFVLMLALERTTAICPYSTPCSQTCGGGFRYRVGGGFFNPCGRTYEECNTQECPNRGSCPEGYEFKYGRKSSCCAKLTGPCGVPSVENEPENIFDSKKAVVGQWPWAAAVIAKKRNQLIQCSGCLKSCSGCLIHKDWVLARGFCVRKSLNEDDYYVLLGSTSIENPGITGQIIKIKKFVRHSLYNAPLHDIGLVQLKHSAALNDYVRPICLPHGQKVKLDTVCVVAGWGADESPRSRGGDLLYVAQRNLPKEACKYGLRDIDRRIDSYTEEENLCFGDYSERACTANNGDIVMCQSCSSCSWYVAGIMMYGPRNCGRGLPEVHVNVRRYEDWINQKIREVLPFREENSCKEPGFQYTPCSQTCGGGYQSKEEPCPLDYSKTCKTYEECNIHECKTDYSCPEDYELMYGRKSSCCAKSRGTCGVPSVEKIPENIFNSEKAVLGQWPWAAVVVERATETRFTSGCLIHKNWVLVDRFCVYSYGNKEDYYVLLGSTSIENPGEHKQIIEVRNFIRHDTHDIGLVQLKKSAILNFYVKPICLPNGQRVKTDTICVFLGWGIEKAACHVESRLQNGGDLLYVAQRNLPGDACVNGLRGIVDQISDYDVEKNLCFGDLSGRACTADNGGLVMCQSCSSCSWYVAGIKSYGPQECGIAGQPEVHANVRKYEDWIRQKICDELPYRDANLCKDPSVSPCSRTCGGGHRTTLAPCSYDYSKLCKKYEECNTHECPARDCCPQKHRFESNSFCCNKSEESCGVPDVTIDNVPKIISDVRSDDGQWPWMAVIVDKTERKGICGGSLIHKDWVLTAAHCRIKKSEQNDLYVLLGSTSIRFPKATKQYISIKEFIVHEDFSPPNHDVGLVRLKTSARFDKFVKPICLPNGESIKMDATCVAAGWGFATETTSDVLRHVSLRNVPIEACAIGLELAVNQYSTVQHLCFGILSGNRDTCNGDSGGPLMCQRCSSCGWYVAGITSYGPKDCGAEGKPALYMHVKNYEDWIKRKVKGLWSQSSDC